MHKWIPLTVALALLLVPSPARADRVDKLIRALKTAAPAAKLGTMILLQKSADPRAVKALIAVAGDKTETPKVRAQAAASLEELGAVEAVPVLRKLTRVKDAYLKGRAKIALEKFCPRSLRRKRYYVNLSRTRATGPMAAVAQRLALVALRKQLGQRADVVLGWPKCKPPSRRLKRKKRFKRLKKFFLDAVVTVSSEPEKTRVRVQLLLTTWPKQSIRANAEASSMLPRKLTRRRLSRLIRGVLDSMKIDLARFLP